MSGGVALTPDHVVDLPDRIKENSPSRRVLIGGVIRKSKEPDDVVVHLEPRSNNPHRLPKNPATREVL